MAKSVDDRGRGARMARRDEGAYCWYVTEEQRSQPGWIGREGDRLSHSRTLSEGLAKRLGRRICQRLPVFEPGAQVAGKRAGSVSKARELAALAIDDGKTALEIAQQRACIHDRERAEGP